MTAPLALDDRRVSRALGASTLLRAADRLIFFVWQAAGQSFVATMFGRATLPWQEVAAHDRRTAVGVALLVAGCTHVGLTVLQEWPAGWLWAVPAGIAATIGLVFVAWPRTSVEQVN